MKKAKKKKFANFHKNAKVDWLCHVLGFIWERVESMSWMPRDMVPRWGLGRGHGARHGHRRDSQQVFSLLGLVKLVVVKGNGPAVWRADCMALTVVADILQEIWRWRSAGAREDRVFRRRSKERQCDTLAWGGAKQGEGRAHMNSWIPPSTVSGNLTFAGVFTYFFYHDIMYQNKLQVDWRLKGERKKIPIKQQEKKMHANIILTQRENLSVAVYQKIYEINYRSMF